MPERCDSSRKFSIKQTPNKTSRYVFAPSQQTEPRVSGSHIESHIATPPVIYSSHLFIATHACEH